MAFDANRELTIQASQAADGTYALRTSGLAKRDRPELEITGVTEPALHAAAGILNLVGAYTVDRAEVLAGQTVGNVLAVGDEGRELLLALRAATAEPASRPGLWGRLGGGKSTKGVLRLLDAGARDEQAAPPLTALATMLVHRAAVRLAKEDRDGARAELEASLQVLPGDPAEAANELVIDGAGGILNWQNHLAYADLAALAATEEDVTHAIERFDQALVRSRSHGRRTVGAASLDALVGLGPAAVGALVRDVVDHNLATAGAEDGPTESLVIVRSPIWECGEGATTQRRAALVPRAFLGLYYEGPVAAALRDRVPALVGRLVGDATRLQVASALWRAGHATGTWVTPAAPFAATAEGATDAHRALSRIIADVARCVRAGLSDEAIGARLSGTDHDAEVPELVSLRGWEEEQTAKAMTS
ncbi:MAG: hypothetical protein JWP97_3453 [Labilithrix sp.]|nr:hypothetical protein [Labilithrix sp.]